MDIFEKYIKLNRRKENCRALTCKSYKNVYEQKHGKKLGDKKTNFELATYGDALLKFALCSILLDEVTQLSEEKKKYEEDKYLIETVAKHYDLLEYMNFDGDNKEISQKYEWCEQDKKTKYIATTVEAVLGAIYMKNHNFKEIRELVRSWIALSEK